MLRHAREGITVHLVLSRKTHSQTDWLAAGPCLEACSRQKLAQLSVLRKIPAVVSEAPADLFDLEG